MVSRGDRKGLSELLEWESPVTLEGISSLLTATGDPMSVDELGQWFASNYVKNVRQMTLESLQMPSAAMVVAKPHREGGINLDTSQMSLNVQKAGIGVEMNMDPAMIERIRKEGLDGLTPVIFRITPITSIWTIVGLQPPPASPDSLLAKI